MINVSTLSNLRRLVLRQDVSVREAIGVWLVARRLNSGKFVWPRDAASTASLNRESPPRHWCMLGLS